MKIVTEKDKIEKRRHSKLKKDERERQKENCLEENQFESKRVF